MRHVQFSPKQQSELFGELRNNIKTAFLDDI